MAAGCKWVVGRSLGQAILIAALMADFLTLIAVAVYAMVIEHGVGLAIAGAGAAVRC